MVYNMELKFDQDGLLSPKDLKFAVDQYLEEQGRVNFTERMTMVVREYSNETPVEEIAQKLNVTRERIRQILIKAQRNIGVKAPPAEVYLYGPMTLEEWIDYKQMDDLREQLKTHLKVYGVEGKDQDGLARLFFISLRNYFQEKSFMFEGEGEE